MPIKFTYSNTKTISVRLQESFISELDFLAKKLSEVVPVNVSRNQILEAMIEEAKEKATFDLNGKHYSLSELLTFFNYGNEQETNNVSNTDNENAINNEETSEE